MQKPNITNQSASSKTQERKKVYHISNISCVYIYIYIYIFSLKASESHYKKDKIHILELSYIFPKKGEMR